jgi:hypothetical protein
MRDDLTDEPLEADGSAWRRQVVESGERRGVEITHRLKVLPRKGAIVRFVQERRIGEAA